MLLQLLMELQGTGRPQQTLLTQMWTQQQEKATEMETWRGGHH